MPDTPAISRAPAVYDFSRPPNLSSAHAAALSVTHEEMARGFAAALASRIRTSVAFESLPIEQHTWANYAATLPSPSILATVQLTPGYGTIIIELDVVTALALVDLMAGGQGAVQPSRRLSELERQNVTLVLRWAIEALVATVGPLISGTGEKLEATLVAIEQTPELLSFAGPSEAVAVLSYTMHVKAPRPVEGTLSIIYPQTVINVALQGLDHRVRNAGEGGRFSVEEQERRLHDSVGYAVAPVDFTLKPTSLPASAIADLQVGDVLTVNHRTDEPAIAWLAGHPIGQGSMGVVGRRVGVRMTGPAVRAKIVAGSLCPIVPSVLPAPPAAADTGADTGVGDAAAVTPPATTGTAPA
jgi:flagellar motor switch protein FliM